MELTCPKCHGTMRTYERNGVHVDQCAECRGIFLDRGELDRLIDAENAWHGGGDKRDARYQDQDKDKDKDRYDDERRHEPRSGSEYRSEPGYRQDQHSGSGGLGAVVGEVLKQVGGSQKHSGYGQQHSSHRPRKKESFLGDLFG
jgi:Zn-finger nucleic acid-binding protein